MRFVLRYFGQPGDSPLRAATLRRVLALSGLTLVAVTWRLWTPQHVFPQVPLAAIAGRLPTWCDWIGAAGMIAGLLGALFAPTTSRWASGALVLFASSTALMVAIDGQRLQPWAYQLAFMALVLVLADARSALALLRLFVVSFYLHSALTKLDYSFMHSLGQQFLSAFVGLFGGALDPLGESWRLAGAAVLPAGELLVAVALCLTRTRPFGIAAAVALHVALLAILGPLGLDHKPGVLVWNAYFIVQDLILFARWPRAAANERPAAEPHVSPAIQAVVLAVVVLPFLSPTGWFDLWPSWGLYASRAERVSLLVYRGERENLPTELRPFIEESADQLDPWLTVRLDRWALDALGAPIYPQSRHQLGVAEAVIARFTDGQRARVVRFDLADRFTGERRHEMFAGLPQLQAAGDEYFLNTRPRMATFRLPGAASPLRPHGGE